MHIKEVLLILSITFCLSSVSFVYSSQEEARDTQSSHSSLTHQSQLLQRSSQKKYSSIEDYVLEGGISEEEWSRNYENFSDKSKIMAPIFLLSAFNTLQAFQTLSPTWFAISLVAGLETTDLSTGLVHVIFDKLNTEDKRWPVEMRGNAQSFQWHHDNPHNINNMSFWRLSRNLYISFLPILSSSLILSYYGYDALAFVCGSTSFFMAHGQIPHAHSHGKWSDSVVLNTLEKANIIVRREVHHKHHADENHNVNFCLFTGHMNFLFNPLVKIVQGTHAFFRSLCGSKQKKY